MNAINIKQKQKKSSLNGLVIFLIILVLLVAGIGGTVWYAQQLDQQSKQYVDEAVPAIVTAWRSEELFNRSSSEFVQVTPINKLDSFFEILSVKLGALQSYQGSQGEAKISAIFPQGVTVTANYTAKAVFENGSAIIKVQLIQRNNNWQILYFGVDSEALSQ